MRDEMTEAVMAYEEKPREQWLFDYPAQVSATASHHHSGWLMERQLLGSPSVLSFPSFSSCGQGCFWPPPCYPGEREDELSFVLAIS